MGNLTGNIFRQFVGILIGGKSVSDTHPVPISLGDGTHKDASGSMKNIDPWHSKVHSGEAFAT